MNSTKTQTVLIVDDEVINVRVLDMTLRDDYEILTAYNGHEAIRLVRERQPDLVLLDVMMPELSGFDVCRIIKADEESSSIPIIFVTALETYADESHGLSLGAADYITKPINPDIVRLRVKNHLDFKLQRDLLKEQRDTLERQRNELEETLGRIKTLEGIIPVCMYCKKIRNEEDTWDQMEKYISDHSDALFSHGVCPECYPKMREAMGG